MDASSSQSMEDNSASKSKLCLKIKIPNSEDKVAAVQAGRGGGGDGGSGSQAGHIICEYCGKQFSSGKAWGGHKRHHLQMMKKKNSKIQEASKLNKEIKKHSSKNRCATIYAGDVTVKDGIPTCRLCGKIFPSMNSLFGHMRFHTERYRKGSQSPLLQEAEDGNQEKDKSERRTIDLSGDLVGWLKKDWRGRKRFPDMIIPEAAHNLITLSRHRVNQCTSKKYMAEADRSNPSPLFDSSSHSENRDEPKRKKMKLNYISKRIVTESENLIKPEEATRGLVKMETETPFHCEICNKIFETGQALGGHKRCHWKAPAPAKPVSMEVIVSTGESNDVASASSGEAPSQAANGRLNIDLNKPYMMQDGEED